LAEQKRYVEAEKLLRDNYAALLAAIGPAHPAVVRTHGWIEDLYRDWGKSEEAQRFFASTTSAKAPQ
jgi:hypothetical protein